MRTDPRELDNKTYDLLVVGGGIQGAAIAREAAMCGRKVLLVEARDFAWGSSSRSSRLLHGGLRYLAQGNLALVREALEERERLLRQVPHLARPVPMLMPFYPDSGMGPFKAKLGIRTYAMLARRSTLPSPRAVSAREAAAAFPGLRTRDLRGGMIFFDAATSDARLTIANVQAAVAAGAQVANHCELVARRPHTLILRDHVSASEVQVRVRTVVNATGTHADMVRARMGIGAKPLVRASRGSHLVLPARPGETALCAFLPDERIQFVIPHRDGTVCGTTDEYERVEGQDPSVPEEDIDYLLDALAWLMESAPARGDIVFGSSGWRALPVGKGPPGAIHRDGHLVHEQVAGMDLWTVVGGKLTTHRSFAERACTQVVGGPGRSSSRDVPLPGGEGPRDVQDPLWWRHGSAWIELRALCEKDPSLAAPLCPHRPFLRVELVHAARTLGAVSLADALLRRLASTTGPCLEPGCLAAAYELHAAHAAWPMRGKDAEVAAVTGEVQRMLGDLLVAPAAR